jgi:hypothetical protein
MRWLVYLHFSLWFALFAVFIWISAPIVGSAVMENRIGPVETNCSIDTYLRGLTGIEHGSEKISEAFRHLGKEGRLIIFVRNENDQSEFLGMMIGYLSWPREIQIVKVPGETVDKELANIQTGAVAGAVFCSVSPPPRLQNRLRLGSSIVLVPVTQAAP